MRNLILVLAGVACVLTASPAASAQAVNAAGRWDVTFNTPQGPMNASMTLTREAEKLTGTLSGPQGDLAVEGSQKEKAVTLYFTVEMGNGPIPITMSGTQEGESMSGSFDFGGGQGDWTAARAAGSASADGSSSDGKLDVSGSWTLDVTTAGGSGTPTITLKQNGEALTGEYSGQLGQAQLSGTLKGSDITFSFDVTVEGNAVHVVYTGTAGPDAMKGRVDIGGGVQGTFSGKRTRG